MRQFTINFQQISFLFWLFIKILEAFARAEKKKKPTPVEMFHDVYAELPVHLKQQIESMKSHVQNNKEHYALDSFEPM